MSYKKGDIVVVKFLFILKEDTERRKGRPALVIFVHKVERRYKDVILDFIMTMPEELISRKIGVLPRNVEKEVEGKIKRALGVNTT